MGDARADSVSSVSISELYDTCLVPLIFDPYAEDLVDITTALRAR